MTDPETLRIVWEPVGKSGRIRVTVHIPGGDKFVDKLDVTSFRSREKFLKRFCKGREGIDSASVRRCLEEIASELVERPSSGSSEGSPDGAESGSPEPSDRQGSAP